MDSDRSNGQPARKVLKLEGGKEETKGKWSYSGRFELYCLV